MRNIGKEVSKGKLNNGQNQLNTDSIHIILM